MKSLVLAFEPLKAANAKTWMAFTCFQFGTLTCLIGSKLAIIQ